MTEVVFIHGVQRRSGTNFLHDLLTLHPDVSRVGRPVWENFLLEGAEHLERYVDETRHKWDLGWGVGPQDTNDLRLHLGQALKQFLVSGVATPVVVAKTPRARGLMRFFDYFPDSRLLIIVRDGRALVESGVRTFGLTHDHWTRAWVEGARLIQDFLKQNDQRSSQYMVIKYEDLVLDRLATLRSILLHLNLDVDKYDMDAACSLDVRGSSQVAQSEGGMHWEPVKPRQNFDPVHRFSDWTARAHRRFNSLASREMTAFGYALHEPDRSRDRWLGRLKERANLARFRKPPTWL